MAINFPDSLDNFSNPTSTSSLDAPSHSLQHSDINDAVEALQIKVGIGNSPAGSAVAGDVLTAQGGGTAIWASASNLGGLAHISTQSFSAASSVNFNSVISNSFDYYVIIVRISTTSSTGNLQFRFRNAGSEISTTNYDFATHSKAFSGGAIGGSNNINQSQAIIGTYGNSACSYVLTLTRPEAPAQKSFNGNYADGTVAGYCGGRYTGSSAADGFGIIPSAGNITGQASIWGYKT